MIENVGQNFDLELLEKAQAKTWQVVGEISKRVVAGQSEEDAHMVAKTIFKEFGVEKVWHPSKIRFAQNTLKIFSEVSERGVQIKDGEPFFIDLGLVFFGHEGDCGQTFILGENAEMKKMIAAGRRIFDEVRSLWEQNRVSGDELYQLAKERAREYGYQLNLRGASGHRVGDFPHAIHHRGALKDVEKVPAPHRWILEIQIKHPSLPYGAFYEDLLK